MADALRPLRHGKQVTKSPNIQLIYIPGPSTAAKSKWTEFTKSWQSTLTTSLDDWLANRSHSYVYDYDIPLETISSWKPLLDEGPRLLGAVQKLIAEEKDAVSKEKQSIVFVCHSLGGIVLKQALNIAQDAVELYGTFLKLVSGVVFIACPHGNLEQYSHLQKKVTQLLQSAGVDCNTTVLSKTTDQLLGVGRQFTAVCSDVRFPILSIYEEAASQPSRHLSFSRRRRPEEQVIIDKELARIGCTGRENLVGIANDHWHIGRLEDHQKVEATEAIDFLKAVIEQAQASSTMRVPSASVTSPKSRSAPPISDNGASADASISIRSQRTFTVQSLVDSFALPVLEADLPCYLFEKRHQDRHFYGRTEILERLDNALLPSRANALARLVALCGSPGLGKSEVAAEFVSTRREEFDAIFWVQADDKAKMQRDFALIAIALRLDQSQGRAPDLEDCRRMAKAWLQMPNVHLKGGSSTQRDHVEWLIVFDGIADISLLNEYAEVFAHGAVLVTSRDPSSARSLSSNGVMIEVPPFSDDESVHVMQMILERDQQDPLSSDQHELAREVAISLGGWPLALRQMAGIMREQYLSLDELRDSYQDPEQRSLLQSQSVAGVRDHLPRTMAQVVAMAIELLSPQARCLVDIFSMLDYGFIQESVLEHTKNLTPLPCFPAWKSKDYRDARAQLIKMGLVTYNQASRSYIMHRVIQETIRLQIEPLSFGDKFRFTVTLVVAAWRATGPRQRHQVKSWSHYAQLFSHVGHLQGIYPEYELHDESEPYELLAWLLNEGAWWRHETGTTQVVEGMLHLAKAICEQLPESKVVDLLSDIYHVLGGLANESNRGEDCLRYNICMVDLQERHTGPKTSRLAMAYNQRGTGYMMVKQYREAMADFERSRSLFNELPQDAPCMDTMPTVNLAVAYWLTGDLETAEGLLTAGLRAREQAYGINDTDSFRTGRYLHTLGNVKYDQAMQKPSQERAALLLDSEQFHRRALAQYQSTIGIHHRTADVCHRVAEHCLRKEDYESANRLIDEALKIWEVDKAAFKPEIARTTFLKSACAASAGQQQEAIELRTEAGRLRDEVQKRSSDSVLDLQSSDFDEIVAFWSR